MANKSRNRLVVPEARGALDNMKFEIANELGVNYNSSNGYYGDLTSRENGSVGGYMVKRMIQEYQNSSSGQ